MQIKKQIKFVIALLLIFLPTTALAASVTLRWQANQEPDISSYNVYYGTASRSYGQPIPTGNVTSYTVDNLTAGTTYYFGLTAVDTSGNESGYSSELTANATSSQPTTQPYQLLISTRSDRSNAVDLSGQTISGDVYIFLNPEANVSQVVFSIDGQTHNTESYAPYDLGNPFDSSSLSNGSHTISALVRLQDGTTETVSGFCTIQNDQTQTVPTVPPSALTLSTSVASPVSQGDVVEITAQPTGGSNLEYLFMIGQGSKNKRKWVVVQDYSSDNTFTWDTSAYSGSYLLQAYVRNVGSTATYQKYARISSFVVSAALSTPTTPLPTVVAPSSLSISTDTPSPVNAGTVVEITAQPTGGSNLEYLFMIGQGSKPKRKWVVVQDYSSDNTFTWDTSAYSGSYLLQAYVRNVGSTATYQRYARISSFVVNSN